MPLSFSRNTDRDFLEGVRMEKKGHIEEGNGSRAGAIVYIVVAILSVWFFYWFGNIGATGYSGH